MSSLKESGTTTESMPCSKPRTRANARPKRSAGGTRAVQLPEAREADSQAVTPKANHSWVNPLAWFTTMGVMLGYGMYQHDNSILFWVMVLVTIGCGYGQAVEVLLKYVKLKPSAD